MTQLARNEAPHKHLDLAPRRIATDRRRPARILFVDGKESDLELRLQELKPIDFAIFSERVQTPADFRKRLHGQSDDGVLRGYSMANWKGAEALELWNQTDWQLPSILTTRVFEEDWNKIRRMVHPTGRIWLHP